MAVVFMPSFDVSFAATSTMVGDDVGIVLVVVKDSDKLIDELLKDVVAGRSEADALMTGVWINAEGELVFGTSRVEVVELVVVSLDVTTEVVFGASTVDFSELISTESFLIQNWPV
jgi:uncharacterized protein YaiE (UPF0345 family)